MSFKPMPTSTLLAQGSCCGSGCFNCPFVDERGHRHVGGAKKINYEWVEFSLKNQDKSWEEFEENTPR